MLARTAMAGALLVAVAAQAQAPVAPRPWTPPPVDASGLSPGAPPGPAGPGKPPTGQGENYDWAYLSRYRAANADLPPASARRVVFIGDSITEGWGRQPYLTGNPDRISRGISAQTARQMLVRFRADVIALKPAIVHIMAGTNDIAQNTGPETLEEGQGYITDMVELAQANGIKVVLASVPPALDFWWHRGLTPGPKIRSMNEWLRRFAAQKHIVYVDYWPVLATPDGGMKPEFSADGVHPNPAGYAAMQPLAEAALKKAVARR